MSDRDLRAASRYLNGYPDGVKTFINDLTPEVREQVFMQSTTFGDLLKLIKRLRLSSTQLEDLRQAITDLVQTYHQTVRWRNWNKRASELSDEQLETIAVAFERRSMMPREDRPTQRDAYLCAWAQYRRTGDWNPWMTRYYRNSGGR